MKLTLILALAIPLAAQTKPQAKALAPQVHEIRAEDQADDPPGFKRKYFAKLTSKQGITMTLECEYDHIFRERSCRATLRQPDEKSVSFLVGGRYAAYDSIADQILDPVIVPETKRLSEEMHQRDVQYMLTNPTEFKTSDGNRWRKTQ